MSLSFGPNDLYLKYCTRWLQTFSTWRIEMRPWFTQRRLTSGPRKALTLWKKPSHVNSTTRPRNNPVTYPNPTSIKSSSTLNLWKQPETSFRNYNNSIRPKINTLQQSKSSTGTFRSWEKWSSLTTITKALILVFSMKPEDSSETICETTVTKINPIFRSCSTTLLNNRMQTSSKICTIKLRTLWWGLWRLKTPTHS